MRPWLAVFGLAACYAPTAPTGAPCATDSDCPPPQVCRTTTDTCELSQAEVDAPDAPPPDMQTVTCWDAWLAGEVSFTTPTRVESLRVAGTQTFNASLSDDELTIYITRANDLLRAARPTRDAPFGQAELVDGLQSPQQDSRLSTTADGLLGVFASNRTGTLGQLDLWQTSRATTDEPFGAITAVPLAAFNNANQQFDPELAPNGLAVYWSPSVGGIQTIHRASRTSRSEVFGNEIILPLSVPNIVDFFDPSISPDERVLVVAGEAAEAESDLYYTTRSSPNGTFGPTIALTDLNTPMHEGDPELAADGCTIYFASNRDGQTDIYSANLVR